VTEVAAGSVAAALTGRAPTLGGARLLCVDGPAGSGKTTLAGSVADTLRTGGHSVAVVHRDDLYRGWQGLWEVGAIVAGDVLAPLARRLPGRFRRYDWPGARLAEEVEVPLSDVLVLEGVGSADPAYAALTTLVVWVEAPRDLRLRRGLARDGAQVEPQWRRWLDDEAVLHRRHRTRDRADLRVDGVTGAVLAGGRGQS